MEKDPHLKESFESEVMDEIDKNLGIFNDESVDGISMSDDVSKTGKRSNLILWAIPIVVAVIGLISFLLFLKPNQVKSGIKEYDEGRFAEAIDLFEEALSKDPDRRDKIRGPYSQALRGQATALMDLDPAKSESLLLKAIRLDPQNTEAHFLMGRLHVRQKNYANAIKSYRRVVRLKPRHPDALFNLGYIYSINKDYPKAERLYNRVISLNPDYLDEALFNLAMVQRKQGKEKESIKNLKRALGVNPCNELAYKYLYMLVEN